MTPFKFCANTIWIETTQDSVTYAKETTTIDGHDFIAQADGETRKCLVCGLTESHDFVSDPFECLLCNYENPNSYNCGENNGAEVKYTLVKNSDGEDTYTVLIRGKGAMNNYESALETYGKSPFVKNGKITQVVVEEGVTSIGDNSFSNCTGLTSVTIPESVTTIGEAAFSECSDLSEITIPGTVKTIGKSAFVSSGISNITISEGVETISGSAFYNCKALKEIIIPESVTTIGDGAFSSSGLTDIVIPENITSIGAWTFSNCWNLVNVTI